MSWAWAPGGSALQRTVWIRERWHPNIQNLAGFGYGGWQGETGGSHVLFQQLGSCRRGEAGIGRNRLHQEGTVSIGLAASGRSVGLVFYRTTHCLVVGSPLELDCVPGSVITGLANSLYVKETSQLIYELSDGRKSWHLSVKAVRLRAGVAAKCKRGWVLHSSCIQWGKRRYYRGFIINSPCSGVRPGGFSPRLRDTCCQNGIKIAKQPRMAWFWAPPTQSSRSCVQN